MPAQSTSRHGSISPPSAAAVPHRTPAGTDGDVTSEHPEDIAGHRHRSCQGVISTCPVIPPGTARSTNPLPGKCASQKSGSSYHGNKERFLSPTPPKYLFASQGFTGYLLTTTTTAAKPERRWSRTNKSGLGRTSRNHCVSAGGVTDAQDEPVNRPRISAYALHTNMQVQRCALLFKGLSRSAH